MTAPTPGNVPLTMRTVFAHAVEKAMVENPKIALVLAEISRDLFADAAQQHPDRVINVGIREQLMVSVGGGLALSGLRPIIHTYGPFLMERPFEQIKLDLGHQEVGAVLVSIGASYDDPAWGRTHQVPADVALLDALPGWSVHVPGHPQEVAPILSQALAHDGREYIRLSTRTNTKVYRKGSGFTRLKTGRSGVVLAVGPVADAVLTATAQLDVTVLYAATIRPFDAASLTAAVAMAEKHNVVVVEPYLRGTSALVIADALAHIPHRALFLGVRRDKEVHAYGTAEEHDIVHGLNADSIAHSVQQFLAS